MYRAIEGIYDKGRIIPLEEINVENKKYRVMIILLQEINEGMTSCAMESGAVDIKKLTVAYLDDQIERKGSIRDIKLDSQEVENYLTNAFGTEDVVEIINMIRR